MYYYEYLRSEHLRSVNLHNILALLQTEGRSMNARDYFPLGKAHGEAFCNRTIETQWLVDNIQACKHSLLIAPRRFGKSSLADKAIEICHFPVVCLNFNTCSDEQDVDSLIRQGVSHLIGKAIGPIEKSIEIIKNFARHLTPKINLGTEHTHLELAVNKQNNPAANVQETLGLIEQLLENKKRRAILLMDEFQTVGLIAKSGGVEAAIRNMAQDMRHLSIIFSGSNRSLLRSMFDDQSRPLYKICRKLHLDRISEEHYEKHLNKSAKLAWGMALEEKVFIQIMLLSERHPYYVNYLCDVLWANSKQVPSVADVENAWAQVIEEEYSDANAEITHLSMGQRKVLKYVANNSGEHLMAASSISKIGMALSSVASAITGLIEKDIIEKNETGYEIINPIVKHLLCDQLDFS